MAALIPQIATRSERGQAHPLNEEALFDASQAGAVAGPGQLARHGYLLAVSDGEGGPAAALVIQELAALYYAQVGANVADNLRRAIHEANIRVQQRARATTAGAKPAGATLVAAVIKDNLLYVASVGHSRAYLYRAGKLWPLTRDHVHENGAPSRMAGVSPYLDPDIFLPLKLAPGDRVLLCSDGLTNAVTDEELLGQLTGRGAVQEVPGRLLLKAREVDSQNDISVVVAHVGRVAGAGAGPAGRHYTPLQLAIVAAMTTLAVVLAMWLILELYWMLSL